MSTSEVPVPDDDAQGTRTSLSAEGNTNIGPAKTLGNSNKQLTESATDVDVRPHDAVHFVQDPIMKDQSSLKSKGKQGPAMGGISYSTNGAVLQDLSQDADGHAQGIDDVKYSPRTLEDIWNIVNELKTSVDHILSRDFALTHQVKAGHPSTRDPTVMPLIASKRDGTKVTIWAKMDTGADKNFISPSLIAKLGRDTEVKMHDGGTIHEIDGKGSHVTHSIIVDFFAGLSNQPFSQEFYVIGSKTLSDNIDPAECASTGKSSATEGIVHLPDILLGGPFLKDSHALVTDPDFENPANPEYQVLADVPPAGWNSCYWAPSSKPAPSRAFVKNPARPRPGR